MTGSEIRAAAQRYVDELIDPDDALVALNQAIAKLADMALVYSETQIQDAAAKAWYPLPANLTYLVHVLDADGNRYNAFDTVDGLISFTDGGTYTIRYRRPPARLMDLGQTPELHESYHPCLVDYLIGWWELQQDNKSTDGQRHMEEFNEGATRVFNLLRRKRGLAAVTVVR